MTSMTRRQLMGTAAMAAVAAGVAGRATLAQGSADKAAIDQALRQAAEARQVPGVVAWRPPTRARSTRARSASASCRTARP